MKGSDWQAVVLCGGVGYRMTDITDHMPKCLLPIAGIPMFWYPLNFLRKNDVKDVFLVVQSKTLAEVKSKLASDSVPSLSGLNIEYVPLGSSTEEWGTADVLRHISTKIKKDFLVVSGDFVSDMRLAKMIELHQAEQAAFTCLLAENVITGSVPGPRLKRSRGRDLIALSESDSRILFLGSEDDFEGSVPIKSSLFSRFKNVLFTAKYNDCHVYAMKRWVLNILELQRNISSIKFDLIPLLLELQYSNTGPAIQKHLDKYLEHSELDKLIHRFSGGSEDSLDYKMKCCAYTMKPDNGFVVSHVNTIGAYFEVNKTILRFLQSQFFEDFPIGQYINPIVKNATVSESFIGQETKFLGNSESEDANRSRNSVIKRSVIGTRCTIAPGSKITNSLIMDDCTIGAGTEILSSIVCCGVEIGESCDITSCIVTNSQKVPSATKISYDVLSPDDEMDLDE